MSFTVDAWSAAGIQYAGRPMPILVGLRERPAGFAIADLTVPAERHGFANPSDTAARVLGIWGPSGPAMEF